MPRKKIVDQSLDKVIQEKPPRKRARKEKVAKPKLKTPTIIKIKMPLPRKTQNALASPCFEAQTSPTRKKRALSPSGAARRKIELANEVAQAQLVKPVNLESERLLPCEDKPSAQTKKRKTAKNRGKRKKNTSQSEELQNEIEEPKTAPPVKKPRKAPVKLVKKTVKLKPNVSKQMTKADSTSTKPKKGKSNVEAKMSPRLTRQGKVMPEVTSSELQESPSIIEHALKCQLLSQNDEANALEISTDPKSPAPIDSRKTSVSECLSWTKDISSSSTTTCRTVGSNDFYRIDKKLPVIKLDHIDNAWKRSEDTKEASISDSDSNEDTKCSSSRSGTCSRSSRSLSLSSSSSESHHSGNYREFGEQSDDICNDALNKLSSQLKKTDLEFISWLGHDNDSIDAEVNIFKDKILRLLKEENEVIEICRSIKNLFKPSEEPPTNYENENDFLERANPGIINLTDRSEDDEFTTTNSRYVMLNCEKEEDPLQVANGSLEGEDFASNKVPYMTFEDEYNDDDDALSLFAESITGIESSRFNSSASMSVAVSEHDEYVPQPVSTLVDKFERPTYQPTKIAANDWPNTSVQNRRIICEKQNADTTYKESENDVVEQPEMTKEKTGRFSRSNVPVTAPPLLSEGTLPSILDPQWKPRYSFKSPVFKGVCFYNLISNCKKVRCTFPHIPVEDSGVRNTLAKIGDRQFLEEYIIMRSWPPLRRKYGILYVDECRTRGLTRTLIEMNIDFILKTNRDSNEDLHLKVNITEETLMYLNNVDLNEYRDLLSYTFMQDIFLCDVYIHTIAKSQNFSRFKPVFINLTDFICSIGRTFLLEVANHILDRVRILPPDLPLAEAMLKIIKNTDTAIFNNPVMGDFGKLISSLGGACCEEFAVIYENAVPPVNAYNGLPCSQEKQMNISHTERENRYTSPDTTKLDNLSKTVSEPVITRMINNIPINTSLNPFNPRPHATNSSNSRQNASNPRPSLSKTWRVNNYNRYNKHLLRPSLLTRSPIKRPYERQVAFGPVPKFPRRRSPDFQ